MSVSNSMYAFRPPGVRQGVRGCPFVQTIGIGPLTKAIHFLENSRFLMYPKAEAEKELGFLADVQSKASRTGGIGIDLSASPQKSTPGFQLYLSETPQGPKHNPDHDFNDFLGFQPARDMAQGGKSDALSGRFVARTPARHLRGAVDARLGPFKCHSQDEDSGDLETRQAPGSFHGTPAR